METRGNKKEQEQENLRGDVGGGNKGATTNQSKTHLLAVYRKVLGFLKAQGTFTRKRGRGGGVVREGIVPHVRLWHEARTCQGARGGGNVVRAQSLWFSNL